MSQGEPTRGPSGGGDGGPRDTPIEDYAVIGNCRTAALIGKDGSLDWLCLPRFDGPCVFGALLDRAKGGSFRIWPTGAESEVSRRYLPDTPVLETTFTTPSGVLRVTDFMPVDSEDVRARRPRPEQHLVRRVECLEGEVDVRVECGPRPDYARAEARVEDRGPLGLWWRWGSGILVLASDLPLGASADGRAALGGEALKAGSFRNLSLTYAGEEPAVLVSPDATLELLDATLSWWKEWAGRCEYDGPWREAVVRSALTLKLLTYAPSGAVVAAATTSLPEVEGGSRNWDYRYCWLRDASWTLRALFELGYTEEAAAFYGWFMYATRLTAPELQTVYDLSGGNRLHEHTLDHLSGWRGSRPVRIGNAAHEQLQLDVYGEVVSAAYEYIQRGGVFDPQEERMLVGLGKAVCRRWREPDEGIWEVRGGRRHWTYSKVMCAVALQRLLDLHEEDHLRVPVERFRRVRDEIRDAVDLRSRRDEDGGYRGAWDLDLPDAALLRLPMVGFVQATAPAVRRTFEEVKEKLGAGHGLIYRYPPELDDLEGREGTFGICSFWAVEHQALAGELDAAREDFETMLEHANDVGLYSEQIDVRTGAFLGNFPQAFTHLGLINAALTIHACAEEADQPTPWEHERAPAKPEERPGTEGSGVHP